MRIKLQLTCLICIQCTYSVFYEVYKHKFTLSSVYFNVKTQQKPHSFDPFPTCIQVKKLVSEYKIYIITKSNRTRGATLWFVLINPNKSAGSIVLRSIRLVRRQVASASEWGLLKRFVSQPLPWFGFRRNWRIESFSLKSFKID